MMKWKLNLNKKQYSLPIKMLLLMVMGNIGPILLLTLYESIRFHEILFGKGDILTVVYASSILLSLAFTGYIVCEITKPVKALIASIEGYRLKKAKPILQGVTRAEEFNYLFSEYEKLIVALEHFETELIHKTTLATIGSTTAMVAHDVRKPLTAMQMFLRSLPEDDSNMPKNIIREIEKSIVRTNAMLDDILEFSHELPQLERKNHSIQKLITKALDEIFYIDPMLQVNLSYDFNHGNKNIFADDLRINRVLVNVIGNALEAMKKNKNTQIKGNIVFKTELIKSGAKEFVELKIIDDGLGIPPEIVKKIYEPFFSYGKSNGNGLGLAICKNIMVAHGGDIVVKNRTDGKQGAEVNLLLAAGNELAKADNVRLAPSPQAEGLKGRISNNAEIIEKGEAIFDGCLIDNYDGRSISILIVDDEKIVRTLLHNAIASLFRDSKLCLVEEASSAEEALLKLEKCGFHFIITDIDFGKNNMDGYKFAEIVLRRYQDLRVIVHSNKRDPLRDEELRQNFTNFGGSIQKPITKEQLFKFFPKQLPKDAIKEENILTKYRAKYALFLNDDAAISFSMEKVLQKYAINVCCVTNVEDAFSKFLDNSFDFILSDIDLGNDQENGYAFLEKVRALNKTIPFIVMSGYNKKQEQEKAIMLGATAYIQTPFKIRDLLEGLPWQ